MKPFKHAAGKRFTKDFHIYNLVSDFHESKKCVMMGYQNASKRQES
jgi:hypothetical protein